MIITKEKDEKNLGRQTEFPKLIIEEENINIKDVESSQDKTLSTREIITFLLFCTFFIIVVYMQLNIETSYAMNSAIKQTLSSNETFLEVNIEEDYWEWVETFIGSLYSDKYYGNYAIEDGKKHAIPNLNVIVSPISIT